jgi:hypothetical protein
MSTADALAAVRTAPSGPVVAPVAAPVTPAAAQPRISGASPAITVPPVDEEPPPLPPITPEPSVVVSDDPRATIPGPAPAPRPAGAVDVSPATDRMPVPSPYPSAAPYLEAAAATSESAATSTIPGVGVNDTKRAQSGDDDDLVPPRAAWLAFLTPRNLAIGGGALVLLIVVIVFATRGGDDSKSASKRVTTAKVDSKSGKNAAAKTGASDGTSDEGTHEPSIAVAKPTTGDGDDTSTETGATAGSDASAAGSDATIAATTEPPATTGSATPPTPPKPKLPKRPAGSTLGGKQVVLEYDSQARDTSAPAPANVAKSDQTAITKARTAYASGNQRLFAGDTNAAIKFYRQALSYYPAYVAGYRGLGLAYAQQGNKPQALQAFKTYVSSVPNAKDAALIRKRITILQAR